MCIAGGNINRAATFFLCCFFFSFFNNSVVKLRHETLPMYCWSHFILFDAETLLLLMNFYFWFVLVCFFCRSSPLCACLLKTTKARSLMSYNLAVLAVDGCELQKKKKKQERDFIFAAMASETLDKPSSQCQSCQPS